MESFLKPVDSCSDSTRCIYRLSDGQKFVCPDYKHLSHFLAESLLESDYNHELYIDWSEYQTHPLIFVISVKSSLKVTTFHELLIYFNSIFLPSLEYYLQLDSITILLSLRRCQRGGMLVHVLNVELSHDDYVHLCTLMQNLVGYEKNNYVFELACPSTMSLVASDTFCDEGGLFLPTRLVNVAYQKMSHLGLGEKRVEHMNLYRETSHGFTLYDQVRSDMDREFFVKMACLSMPVPSRYCFHDYELIAHLSFSTQMVAEDKRPKRFVARFKSCVNQRNYFIVKKDNLLLGSLEYSFGHRFLKNHSRFIDSFETSNRALETWYGRFSTFDENEKGFLGKINRELAKRCPHLKEANQPLQLLLTSRELQLPACYALYNLMEKEGLEWIDFAHELFALSPSLSDIPLPPPKEASRLTFDTLLYCAFKTTWTQTKEGMFILHMGVGWDWIFESIATAKEMTQHVRGIQKRFFPVVKGSLHGKENLYSWDPLINQWCKVKEKQQLETIIQFVYRSMMHFEGFFKVPKEILTALQDETEWTDCLVEELGDEVTRAEPIVFHPLRTMYDSMLQVCSLNVPEYYLANEDVEDIIQGVQKIHFNDQ